jgi:signal transduction histidine kinase
MENRRAILQQSWLLLALAVGGLFALIVVSGILVVRDSNRIFLETERSQQRHRERDRLLNNIRLDTGRVAILVRDTLLERGTDDALRREINRLSQSIETRLAQLEKDPATARDPRLNRLRHEWALYRSAIEPVFQWTAEEKKWRALPYLRKVVVPYRERVLAVARDVESLASENLREEQASLRALHASFQDSLKWTLAGTLALGALISGLSIKRISSLEKRSASLRRQTEQNRLELQTLSRKLVQAQEEERKSISRELHDQVGQMLTAVQMEFKNLGMLRGAAGQEFDKHLRSGQALAEQTLRVVRDMAMGLRPSMLDDLGLGPALEWQAREFSGRSGISVSLEIDGELEGLPEGPRTCLYRVVQEALTNCARHAEARQVRITLHGGADRLSLTVQDDGKGFQPDSPARRGLGLIGIEERVRELGGKVVIFSQPRKGTLLRAEVPVAREVRT